MVVRQDFGLTVSESKTEGMRLRSVPSSSETSALIEAASRRGKQTAKCAYLGDAVSEGAHRVGAARARLPKYRFQLCDPPHAQQSLEIWSLLKALYAVRLCQEGAAYQSISRACTLLTPTSSDYEQSTFPQE